MMANKRRTVWVQVALALIVVYFISRETKLKRGIRRAVYIIVPLVAIYARLGWNSEAGSLFKPVRMMRSVVDAKSDGSSMWREIENFDLIISFRNSPLIGKGYGIMYDNAIALPPVDYDLERWIPHNSLLGVWCYGGILGYAGLTMLWAGGVYFAMRTYYNTQDPRQRVACIACFGSVLIYMVQAWGDLGLGAWTGAFTVGASICVAGKLASANGQWITPGSKPKVSPVSAAR
jgi:O-antigen ligase